MMLKNKSTTLNGIHCTCPTTNVCIMNKFKILTSWSWRSWQNAKSQFVFTKLYVMMKSSMWSSSAPQQTTSALKQKACSHCTKAPCKTVKNGILKSVSEEISSWIDKAHKAGQNTYGITNTILHELKESLPWLNCNLYSHYIKHNNCPLMITANTDELQVISSIETPASNNCSSRVWQVEEREPWNKHMHWERCILCNHYRC